MEALSRVVARNTAFNIAGRFWFSLVSFVLTPYIIHRIGIDRYGILAISGAITGYAALFDLGIGSSFARFIAAFRASREPAKIGEVIGIGLVFYAVVGIAVVAAAFFILNPLIALFKIPVALHDEAYIVFLAGFAIFAVANVGSVFVAVQVGLQRMDLMNAVGMAVSCVNIAGTVFVLRKGFGLIGLMANNAVIIALGVAINIAIACILVPDVLTKAFTFSRSLFAQLFSFGWRMQLARVSGLVTTQIDKILIASFLSVGLVSYFQLGSSVVTYAAALSGLLTSSLMPAFTDIDIRDGRDRLSGIYLRSTRYLSFAVVPLFLFLFIFASPVMTVWLSYPCPEAASVIRILAAGWMINTIAQVAGALCVAINKPQFMARGSLIIVLVNLFGSALLIKLFGFSGAAWGSAIAMTAGTLYFLVQIHRALGLSLAELGGAIGPCLAGGCIAGAAALAAGALLQFDPARSPRNWQIASLAFQASVFSVLYLIAMHCLRFFSKEDMAYVKQVLFRPGNRPGPGAVA